MIYIFPPGRSVLPVQQPEKVNVNLWSYLKQCVGKELSKITMPVHWNEPLSLLQVYHMQTFIVVLGIFPKTFLQG